eukprot:gene16407-5008_t
MVDKVLGRLRFANYKKDTGKGTRFIEVAISDPDHPETFSQFYINIKIVGADKNTKLNTSSEKAVHRPPYPANMPEHHEHAITYNVQVLPNLTVQNVDKKIFLHGKLTLQFIDGQIGDSLVLGGDVSVTDGNKLIMNGEIFGEVTTGEFGFVLDASHPTAAVQPKVEGKFGKLMKLGNISKEPIMSYEIKCTFSSADGSVKL